jgi:simple sugar transport system permease protein
MRIRETIKTNEFFLFSVIVVMGIVFALFNPMFFSINNLFDILKSMVEMGIFAMGSLLVLISGGIDLSFMAVAVFAMHSITKFFGEYWDNAPILTLFIAGAGIGTLLGMFNALFIAKFKLASFIVTLGTGNIIKGFLLAFIGSKQINKLPRAMIEFSKSNLITIKTIDGNANLHATVLVLAVVVILVSILLSKTMLGRKIYCVGGNPVSSERVGFNNGKILFFVYSFAGALAGLTGVIHTSSQRMSNPFDLVGGELNVIAAVVIGGPRIGGGYGNTVGTMLGVLLITLINNSLVMLKIPTFWQKASIGFIIILGTVIQIYRYKRKQKV